MKKMARIVLLAFSLCFGVMMLPNGNVAKAEESKLGLGQSKEVVYDATNYMKLTLDAQGVLTVDTNGMPLVEYSCRTAPQKFWQYCRDIDKALETVKDNENIKEIRFTGTILPSIDFQSTNVEKVTFASGIKCKQLPVEFDHCKKLNAVLNLPSCEMLSDSFMGCTSLKKVTFEKNCCIDVMSWSFKNCTALQTIDMSNCRVKTMESTFAGCTNLTTVSKLPNGVIDLSYAFSNCKKLKNVGQLPKSLIMMRASFEGCESLKSSPKLPENLRFLWWAYRGCKNLVSAPKLPGLLVSVDSAFSGCAKLKKAPTIPSNVECMTEVFKNCKSLTGQVLVQAKRLTTNNFCGGSQDPYRDAFKGCSTNRGTKLVVNFSQSNRVYVKKLVATKSKNSHISLGKSKNITYLKEPKATAKYVGDKLYVTMKSAKVDGFYIWTSATQDLGIDLQSFYVKWHKTATEVIPKTKLRDYGKKVTVGVCVYKKIKGTRVFSKSTIVKVPINKL